MTQGERSLFKSFILPFNNAEGLTADGVRGRRSQNQQSGPKVSADVLILDPCSDPRSEQGSCICIWRHTQIKRKLLLAAQSPGFWFDLDIFVHFTWFVEQCSKDLTARNKSKTNWRRWLNTF